MAPLSTEEEAMKYLLSFIVGERTSENASPDEMKQGMDAWSAFDRATTDAGALIACEPVEDADVTIRIAADGERSVTDGPFAESKEQLGGFYLFECKDMDEAIEYAKGIPFQEGTVEVRPVMDFTDLGYEDFTPGPVKATYPPLPTRHLGTFEWRTLR